MLTALPILAQADTGDLIKPIGALILVLIVLVLAVRGVRRMAGSKDQSSDIPAGGFSLGALRDLVKQGKMTQEEYDRTKAQIVAANQRAAEKKTPVANVPPEMKTPLE